MEAGRDEERRVVALGNEDSTLTPCCVFELANHLADFTVDSSSTSNPDPVEYSFWIPDYFTDEEARASLLVFLHKLLLSSSSSPDSVTQLSNTLEADAFSLISGDYKINVSPSDPPLMDFSVAVSYGISSLLDYRCSCLSVVADAVAALSCEAMGAGDAAFKVITSGDGSYPRDVVRVAANLRVLLNDSKLVKSKNFDSSVSDIPAVHGHLREICGLLRSNTGDGLCSGFKVGEAVDSMWNTPLYLASAVCSLVKSSLRRVKLVLDSKQMVEFREVLEGLRPNSLGNLEELLASAQTSQRREDYMQFMHQVSSLVDEARKMLSWEATVSFVSLEGGSLKNVPPVGDKKSEKRKKVLGKGNHSLMQFIRESLLCVDGDFDRDAHALMVKRWSQDLSSLLDPKQFGHKGFQNKVKEILESNDGRKGPKNPKGTRDFAEDKWAIRQRVFAIIDEVFKRHGATGLDTPDFELRETLMGKYGEESKLIYDLDDQGGELCSLRYDLTVPFARYVAMHGLTSFKRYQIGKVHRRDKPSKGRYREFYQCDFDIAGQSEHMLADFEVLKIMTELLNELNIGDYEVKLSHRKLLDGVLAICGVPPEKFRTICSSIDKLDKQSFEHIKQEMVKVKGLSDKSAEAIGSYVKKRGSPMDMLCELKKDSKFSDNKETSDALKDLEILFEALEKSNCLDKVVLDLSLARGLDYYTGIIFEAVFKGSSQVGSIAAGGRYDNLIAMFGKRKVPAVGISLGIERVFVIMEELNSNKGIRATETDVLVSIFGGKMSLGAELASQLWDAKVKAEVRFEKHTERIEKAKIPWQVIVGENELKADIVKLKDVKNGKEFKIPRRRFVEEVSKRVNGVHSSSRSFFLAFVLFLVFCFFWYFVSFWVLFKLILWLMLL